MKNVLIISYYWPPSGGAGVQRWLKFSKYLPQFGWHPIVLTVDEKSANYPQKDFSLVKESSSIETHRTRSFEFYSLYAGMKKDKQVPYGGFSNEGEPGLFQKIARFIRGNFFIPDPRKAWNRFAIKKAIELIESNDIQVIVTTSPPHSTQLVGLQLKKRFPSIRWIADWRDPWTDIYFYDKLYPTRRARAKDRKYEEQVIQNADFVVVVSDSIKHILQKRYGVDDKLQIIPNGYDEDDFLTPVSINEKYSNEIVYTGTLTNEYPLKEIVDLAHNTSFRFRFIGNVTPEFKELIRQNGLSARFTFCESVAHREIIKVMKQAGILLLLIPKTKNNEGILTGKLFEYIGARRPILAIGPPRSDAKNIIESVGGGLFFSYEQTKSVKDEDLRACVISEAKLQPTYFSRKNLCRQIQKLFV